MKVGTHHADDRVGPAVQQYGPADNTGITVETALPQLMAQDDDEILSLFLFFRSKSASEHGSTTHRFEEAVADLNGGNPLCFAVAGHNRKTTHVGRDLFQLRGLFANICDVRFREWIAVTHPIFGLNDIPFHTR